MTQLNESVVTVGGTLAVRACEDRLAKHQSAGPVDKPIGNDAEIFVLRWEEFKPGKRFRALGIVEKDEEGGFVSHSPSLPGAVSQGGSADEALENLREAVAGCIESYMEAGEEIPWVREATFEGEAVVTKWIDIDV